MPTPSNCLIDNNHSDQIGGGITITATSPITLNNVTVANNTASWCIGGVYMYRYNSNLTVNNSILWGNSESKPLPKPRLGVCAIVLIL